MKMTFQIKFGSEKQRVVNFGGSRYLVYILSQKDEDGAMTEFASLMSKEFGCPPSRIKYKGKIASSRIGQSKEGESYIFDVD